MDDGAVLERLRQHQEAILTIMQGAEPLLTDSTSRDVAQLARARWALMRALMTYQRFKHGEIFDPAISRRLLRTAGRAERMKLACVAIGEEFRDYVTKWSSSDVAGDWATYQPAALRMIAKLRAHIDRERVEIATLLKAAA